MDMDWRMRMTEGVQAGTLDADAYFKLLQEAPRMPTKNFMDQKRKWLAVQRCERTAGA